VHHSKKQKASHLYKNTGAVLFYFYKKKKGVGNADTTD
jgi:hypothetical protein